MGGDDRFPLLPHVRLTRRFRGRVGAPLRADGSPAGPHTQRHMSKAALLVYDLDGVSRPEQITDDQKLQIAACMDSLRPVEMVRENGKTQVADLRFAALKDQNKSTRSIVVWHPHLKNVLFLNIGTNQLGNWRGTNLKLAQRATPENLYGVAIAKAGGNVHTGFDAMAQTLMADLQRHPDAHVVLEGGYQHTLIGHSLGGALATNMAAMISAAPTSKTDRITVATFAAPRTFNSAAAQEFDRNTRIECLRFFFPEDVAPKWPPRVLGYEHAGTPVPICLPENLRRSTPRRVLATYTTKGFHSMGLYSSVLHDPEFIQTTRLGTGPTKYLSDFL
mmetsp:Transcript_16429/g.50978  ORF Transcript_16429/g.50978 Transcript_16429/m.50978 type:complete len:333 (-) Transcript_16429:292-1290(-)